MPRGWGRVRNTGAALGNPSAVYRFQTPLVDQQFLESLSWFRGKHAWKFGAEYRAGANHEIRDRGSAGSFTMSPLITDLPGSGSVSGNALASFLLGYVNEASIQVEAEIVGSKVVGHIADISDLNGQVPRHVALDAEIVLVRNRGEGRFDGSFHNLEQRPAAFHSGIRSNPFTSQPPGTWPA